MILISHKNRMKKIIMNFNKIHNIITSKNPKKTKNQKKC